MFRILLLSLILFSPTILADEPKIRTEWKATAAMSSEKSVYFFITDVQGPSVSGNKIYRASLQMICTKREDVIGIRPGPIYLTSQNTRTRIVGPEGSINFYLYRWAVDKKFIWRNVEESQDLIEKMKRADRMTVAMKDELGEDWVMDFNLEKFEAYYKQHRENCAQIHKDESKED